MLVGHIACALLWYMEQVNPIVSATSETWMIQEFIGIKALMADWLLDHTIPDAKLHCGDLRIPLKILLLMIHAPLTFTRL